MNLRAAIIVSSLAGIASGFASSVLAGPVYGTEWWTKCIEAKACPGDSPPPSCTTGGAPCYGCARNLPQ